MNINDFFVPFAYVHFIFLFLFFNDVFGWDHFLKVFNWICYNSASVL